MMDPGHPEHGLWGIVSLAMPETWQHAVNHWLDVVLAFSGLSLVLGYGVLVLALTLLLLPIAFPELSRPRDALWSLVLAALAPLLLLNRLALFSSGGFGELIATVLLARLAAEVGQGRWGALNPDQRAALRHLPRWRRAGTDVVATVVQSAKAAWSATAQAAKAAWSAASRQKSPVEQGQDEHSVQQPDQKPVGKGTPEESRDHAPAGFKFPFPTRLFKNLARVKETSKETSSEIPKQWVRPDPSDETQLHQDGETPSGAPDGAPNGEASAGPATRNVPAPETTQQVGSGDGDPGDGGDATGADAAPEDATPEVIDSHDAEPPAPSEGFIADAGGPVPVPEENAPEELSAPEPVELVENAQSTQQVGGGDGDPGDGDATGADAAPEDAALEVIDSHDAEPPAPSEGFIADAGGPVPVPEENAPEELSAPEPVELVENAQSTQQVGGGDGDPGDGDATGADAAPEDAALEVIDSHDAEPPAPSEEVIADAGGPVPVPEENAPEELSAPEPVELVENAQSTQQVGGGDGDPGDGDATGADAAPEDATLEDATLEVIDSHDAEPPAPSEGFIADAGGPVPVPEENAPEELSAPEPVEPIELVEGAQSTQQVGGGDGDPGDGDATGADAAPEDATPEVIDSHDAEPPAPSEGFIADAGGPVPVPEENAPEELSAPEPVELVENAQSTQQVGGGDGDPGDGDATGADAAPEDAALEVIDSHDVEPPAPSEGFIADAGGPVPVPEENAPEELSAPEPVEPIELVEGAQSTQQVGGGDGDPGDGDATGADAAPEDATLEDATLEVIDSHDAEPPAPYESEGVIADAGGPGPGPTDASGDEAKPARLAEDSSTQTAQKREYWVVRSFEEINVEL